MRSLNVIRITSASLTLALLGLSIPASMVPALQRNDDAVTLFWAWPIYFAGVVWCAVGSRRWQVVVGLSCLLLATLVQVLGLHWIETFPFSEVVSSAGSGVFNLWLGLFVLSAATTVLFISYLAAAEAKKVFA